MNLTQHFKAAKVPPRRYGHKFAGAQNDRFRPRFKRPRRRFARPKWAR